MFTFINIPDHIKKIIDTPEFQRLRQVKQLATVSYRYPSANHTRFEHCIGSFHIARLMIDILKSEPEKRFFTESKGISNPNVSEKLQKEVEIAALLHDIGHGPFGHTMDFLLDRIDFDGEKRHEYFGCKKIRASESKIYEKITEEGLDVENISNFINGLPPVKLDGKKLTESEACSFSFLAQIVKSLISADHIDYLIRDAYHTGVHMVALDLTGVLEWLRIYGIYKFTKRMEKITQIDLAFDSRAIWVLEAMLHSHAAMYKTVYYDHVHRIMQEMLVRAFECYLQDKHKSEELTNLSEDDVGRIMALTDNEAMRALQECESSREILQRVLNREYYRTVLSAPWARLPEPFKDLIKKYPEMTKRNKIPELEKRIADKCGLLPKDVIIDLPLLKYESMHVPLLVKRDDGSYESTHLDVESGVAEQLGRIPRIDKITVAISDEKAIPAAREAVKETFLIK